LSDIEDRKKKFPDYESRKPIVDALKQTLDQDWHAGLEKLYEYGEYESEALRRDIYAFVWQYGPEQSAVEKRQDLVEYLTAMMVKENEFLHGQLVKFLQKFKPEDFIESAAGRVKALDWSSVYATDEIKLLGTANISVQIPRLKLAVGKSWTSSPPALYNSQQWAAALTLARLGEDKYAEIVTKTAQKEPDIIMRATRLFSDLAFTKHPIAYNTLRQYMASQALLPQLKPTDKGAKEAYFAGEQLALHTVGCPVSADDFDENAIAQVKQWADSQSDWIFQ